MDEYRPFPGEPLPDTPEHEEHADEPHPAQSAKRDSGRDARETEDAADAEDVDDAEELDEEEAEEHAQRGRAGRAERAERAAPDLEHPGGHLHGTVVRLNRPRRFGFLRADDGAEVFFHASALESGPNAFDTLRPGQEAEFDCHQDEQGRGLAATLVVTVGEPPEPRQPKPRPERERGRGGRQGGERWRVSVLRERQDTTVAAQLERLLNERGVKPGQFTMSLLETDDGVECWVAVHQGEGK
jgi:cold shock CspA family protein